MVGLRSGKETCAVCVQAQGSLASGFKQCAKKLQHPQIFPAGLLIDFKEEAS